MPSLRRAASVAVAAATTAGILLLSGCTSDAPRDDAATATPTDDAASSPNTEEPTTPPATEDPVAEPTPTPSAPTTPPPDGRTVVTPLVAYAGPGTDPATIEVAGWVPDVIEEGGTCTATVQGTGVTAEAPAFADATSTSCGLIVLPTAPAGQTIVLSYSSTTSAGTSDAVTVAS